MEQSLDSEGATAASPDAAHAKGATVAEAGRRFGYFVAAVVNGALLYVANNLLEWDVFTFLTQDFNLVLPAINVSLWVTLIVNVVRIFYAPRWFVSITEILSLIFSLYATVRLWQVFPFNFDEYWFRWEHIVRAVLILAMAGTAIALLVQVFKLVFQTDEPIEDT